MNSRDNDDRNKHHEHESQLPAEYEGYDQAGAEVSDRDQYRACHRFERLNEVEKKSFI